MSHRHIKNKEMQIYHHLHLIYGFFYFRLEKYYVLHKVGIQKQTYKLSNFIYYQLHFSQCFTLLASFTFMTAQTFSKG